jgi:hypothetical protein
MDSMNIAQACIYAMPGLAKQSLTAGPAPGPAAGPAPSQPAIESDRLTMKLTQQQSEWTQYVLDQKEQLSLAQSKSIIFVCIFCLFVSLKCPFPLS